MIEVVGNLWTYPADFRVITTNGDVRADGACVMGRGCAREAAQKWPKLPRELGAIIRSKGNRVHYFNQYSLFTFPVKRHWQERARLDLIKQSIMDFRILTHNVEATYVLPRPGCGNGQRTWDEVKPLLVDLPDNVFVIDFERS